MNKKDYYKENKDILSNKAKEYNKKIEMRCQTNQKNTTKIIEK